MILLSEQRKDLSPPQRRTPAIRCAQLGKQETVGARPRLKATAHGVLPYLPWQCAMFSCVYQERVEHPVVFLPMPHLFSTRQYQKRQMPTNSGCSRRPNRVTSKIALLVFTIVSYRDFRLSCHFCNVSTHDKMRCTTW